MATLEAITRGAAVRGILPDSLVTIGDVAAHLGVTRDSIHRWMNTNGLPAHRVGRAWRFRLSEFEFVRSARSPADGDHEKPDQNV